MSIIRFMKSLFSEKSSSEYLIESIEFSYNKHRKTFPGYNTHFYLAQAWLAYMKGKGTNIDDPGINEAAFTTTYLISCIPHPECGRALGIFLLYRERPDYIAKREDLQNEFNQLIGHVYEAEENGTIADLYKKYNAEET